MSEDATKAELTADIVSAYVSNNPIARDQLADIIQAVHDSLTGLSDRSADIVEQPQEPAVPINKSLSRHWIVCLESGKRFKSLKRHLATSYGLTPEAYREKWGLRPDYPMVAPEYAERRSRLAKDIGLGRKPKN